MRKHKHFRHRRVLPHFHGRLGQGLCFVSSLLLCSPVLSAIPSGSGLTTANTTSPHTVQSLNYNPAAPAALHYDGFAASLLTFSAGYEVGSVDDLQDGLDRVEKQLESVKDLNFNNTNQLENKITKVLETQQQLNDFLRLAGQKGYLKARFGLQVPLTPFSINVQTINGTLTFGANGHAAIRASVVDSPINIKVYKNGTSIRTINAKNIQDINQKSRDIARQIAPQCQSGNCELKFESKTALYVQGGAIGRFFANYSTSVFSNDYGKLYVGGGLIYYKAELTRALVVIDAGNHNNEDYGDRVRDQLEDRESSSDFGIDLGVMWTAAHYQVGAYIQNLNEPTFDFPTVKAPAGAAYNGQLPTDDTYTMERQITLEAGAYTLDKDWFVGASYELNETQGIGGDPYQWSNIYASYDSGSWWIPGIRLGYRTNHADGGLSYYTLGLTLFDVLTLDAAMSTEDVSIEGSTMPRSAMVSIGFEMAI